MSVTISGQNGIVFPDSSSINSLDSPAFTGVPTAPTAAASDNSTQIATTAFVKNNVSTANSANALDAALAYQVRSLGVGTTPSGVTGEIRATGNIIAYFSDDRLKTKFGNIENAVSLVNSLSGFYYEPNALAQELGYSVTREVGVSAQDVQRILPEVVHVAPIDETYLTVDYARLVPLLIEAIKELSTEIELIKSNS